MVRTDNFSTFYRHDRNGNGRYMKNTNKANYFNSIHPANERLMNATLSPRTSGFKRTMNAGGVPTPPASATIDRGTYNDYDLYQTKYSQSSISSPSRHDRVLSNTMYSSPRTPRQFQTIDNRFGQQPSRYYQQLTQSPRPQNSTGGGWDRHEKNTINKMNLSPRGHGKYFSSSNGKSH